MTKNDKIFLYTFVCTSLLMAGLMTESIRSSVSGPAPKKPMDVSKIKSDIEAAGLAPYEAKHWIVVEE